MATAGSTGPATRAAKAPLVHPGLTVPFVLLVLCFAAWGAAANLTDVLVGVFRSIFDMSNLQSSLVQFSYYGAYFALAIPAAMITRRFGYKAGVLVGLGLAAGGGLLFLPASRLLIAFRRMDVERVQEAVVPPTGNTAGRLWANRHYRYGVIAQFFNVAAQTCVWTFTILYAQDVVGVSAESSGWFLQASLILFLVSRFVMTWLLGLFRPTLLLLVMAVFGVACCLVAMFSLTIVGLLAVVAISASLSLMFPTIYGVALQGLGDDAKFGAAGLVMAILGGALLPMVHAVVMDRVGAAQGFVVPGVCLALVAAYAVFDLRNVRAAPRSRRPSSSTAEERSMSSRRRGRGRWARRLVALAGVAVLGIGLTACAGGGDPVTVGLITKQEVNPFWVTMREVAQDTADRNDVELLTATGRSDIDVDSQRDAIERMVADGAAGILVAPTDSTALVPAIERARAAGVVVVAVDTPTELESAVDALFATDNFRAGELIGQYASAKAAERGTAPVVAMLDLAPGTGSGQLRHDGFLAGFGIGADDPQPVAVDTEGDRDLARAGMERLLGTTPDVDVVYTVNEPAAFGAIDALRAAGRSMDDVIVASVDGGCAAIKDGVRPGDIDATSQQFPENMAREGVLALARAARGGDPPRGYLDTGVRLVTGDPAPGVASEDVAFGVRNCWGG